MRLVIDGRGPFAQERPAGAPPKPGVVALDLLALNSDMGAAVAPRGDRVRWLANLAVCELRVSCGRLARVVGHPKMSTGGRASTAARATLAFRARGASTAHPPSNKFADGSSWLSHSRSCVVERWRELSLA